MFAAQEVADAIPERLGADYLAQDWADLNSALFSALWLEKMAISITIGLIVMVAALNIIASLILLVMEKSRDIAILKTMGSSGGEHPADLHAAGAHHRPGRHGRRRASAGCALIYIFDRYKLIHVPIDVYQISYVPFTLELRDFAIVVIAAIVDLLRRDDLPVAAGVAGSIRRRRLQSISDQCPAGLATGSWHSSKSPASRRRYPVGGTRLTVLKGSTWRSSAARWWRSSAPRASARARCCT